MDLANTLAYYEKATITEKKCFFSTAPGQTAVKTLFINIGNDSYYPNLQFEMFFVENTFDCNILITGLIDNNDFNHPRFVDCRYD